MWRRPTYSHKVEREHDGYLMLQKTPHNPYNKTETPGVCSDSTSSKSDQVHEALRAPAGKAQEGFQLDPNLLLDN